MIGQPSKAAVRGRFTSLRTATHVWSEEAQALDELLGQSRIRIYNLYLHELNPQFHCPNGR